MSLILYVSPLCFDSEGFFKSIKELYFSLQLIGESMKHPSTPSLYVDLDDNDSIKGYIEKSESAF